MREDIGCSTACPSPRHCRLFAGRFFRVTAQNAITAQLSDLMGQQTAQILQTAVASASSKPSGIMATIIGVSPCGGAG